MDLLSAQLTKLGAAVAEREVDTEAVKPGLSASSSMLLLYSLQCFRWGGKYSAKSRGAVVNLTGTGLENALLILSTIVQLLIGLSDPAGQWSNRHSRSLLCTVHFYVLSLVSLQSNVWETGHQIGRQIGHQASAVRAKVHMNKRDMQ